MERDTKALILTNNNILGVEIHFITSNINIKIINITKLSDKAFHSPNLQLLNPYIRMQLLETAPGFSY